MDFIDIRTVMLISGMIYVLCALVMYLLWIGNRARFSGITCWLANFILIAAGNILIFLRGIIPDLVSIVVSNAMVICGAVLGLIGLERFIDRRGPQLHNGLLLAIFVAVQAYFTIYEPSLTFRSLNIAAALLLVCCQCAWLVFVRAGRDARSLARVVGLVYAGFCVVNGARIVELIAHPLTTDNFLEYGGMDAIFPILYQLLMILLTYALALMVANYLQADLKLQEEKFSKAFHSSPYAVTISSLADGTMIEVNRGFEAISGYAACDAVGKTAIDLNLWVSEGDRKNFVAEISASGHVQEKEMRFRKKSGEQIHALFSADIISISGRKAILSSISDITARKKAEEKIQNLLREKEILLKEVHHRVKNNMSTVHGLLAIRANEQDNAAVKCALLESAGRVKSMAVLYDKLYRSEIIGSVSIKAFLPSLLDEIVNNSFAGVEVHVTTDIDDIVLGMNLLSPLGIIINELVTNAVKYGFEGRQEGSIRVTASRRGNRIVLVFEDDGRGIPDSVSVENSPGFGLQLVRMLVQQIDGTIAIERTGGTKFIIGFEA